MKSLNHNGIGKVISHLSSKHNINGLSVGTDNNGYFLVTVDEVKISKILESSNVKTAMINGRLRLLAEEAIPSKPPVTSTSTVTDDNIKNAAEQEADKNGFDMNNDAMVKALAVKLLPELLKTIPTKDEVNAALNMLKRDSVQDNDLAGGLKQLTKDVKRGT